MNVRGSKIASATVCVWRGILNGSQLIPVLFHLVKSMETRALQAKFQLILTSNFINNLHGGTENMLIKSAPGWMAHS